MTGHPFDKPIHRGKPPATVRAIESWIQQAEQKVGIGSGRLGWMVATSVVISALQRSLSRWQAAFPYQRWCLHRAPFGNAGKSYQGCGHFVSWKL